MWGLDAGSGCTVPVWSLVCGHQRNGKKAETYWSTGNGQTERKTDTIGEYLENRPFIDLELGSAQEATPAVEFTRSR
jgi:hypothetical protein